MGNKTKIEWVEHTWSPWEGCTKVSPGCLNCYAEANNRRWHAGENWGKGAPRRLTKSWSTPERFNISGRICDQCGTEQFADRCGVCADQPLLRRKMIFTSICDWLDDEVPIQWFVDFLEVVSLTQNLEWMLLTKRPENFYRRMETAWKMGVGTDAQRFQDWLRYWGMNGVPPKNVSVGISCEDQEHLEKRLPELLKISARCRFISFEPLLGPVDLQYAAFNGADSLQSIEGIHWVIVGGESGRNARPCNVAWVRSIVHQCHVASIPCFVKQLGSRPVVTTTRGQAMPNDLRAFSHPKGGDPSEWPENLRVRQMPKQ